MKKLKQVYEELTAMFPERESVIRGLCLSLLSRQHLLIIGPPGTGKSMLIHEFCQRLQGGKYFSYLMSNYTRPDELIGSVSIRGLEEDDYRRVLDDRIGEAHIAFLDEVFHANSSCINSLLSIMNERRLVNGKALIEVPLLTLVGASNQLPLKPELHGFQDRFLLRYQVEYLQVADNLAKIVSSQNQIKERSTFTLHELRLWQRQASQVQVPSAVVTKLMTLVARLRHRGLKISDRRIVEAVKILQSHAIFHDQLVVELQDFPVLADIFWQQPEERSIVLEEINRLCQAYTQRAAELLLRAQKFAAKIEGVQQRGRLQALGAEVNLALTEITEELAELCRLAEGDQNSGELVRIKKQAEQVQTAVIAKCLGMAAD